jgi:hypothetical protein
MFDKTKGYLETIDKHAEREKIKVDKLHSQ